VYASYLAGRIKYLSTTKLVTLFGPGSTRVHILVLKGYDGDAKSESKVRPGCRTVPGYCGSSLSHDVYLDSVIGDL
jgi:hypothetical protein